MKPAARLQAAIDVLSEVYDSTFPADRIIRAYFRKRRYAGSRDRRAVSEQVYGVLRRRGLLEHALPGDGRARMHVFLANLSEMTIDQLVEMLADGGDYGPAPLTDAELAALQGGLEAISAAMLPRWAELNIPAWLADHLQDRVGEDWAALIADSSARAAMDIRVNASRIDRDELAGRLSSDGISTQPFGWSGNCLRVDGNPDLSQHPAFRDGLFEIQDAGSQLVCRLMDVQPGMTIADVCAGAGGKTLSLADHMRGQGTIHALDVAGKRLQQLEKRAVRAGVKNVKLRVADMVESAPDDLMDAMDRVLVDAPCTGTGTWRRNPENRWRLTSDTIATYRKMQLEILANAAKLVMPGGRMVYATCSILPDENVTVITEFLTAHPDFHPISIEDVLVDGEEFQPSGARAELAGWSNADTLQLTTGRHGTDGFYAAVLERYS